MTCRLNTNIGKELDDISTVSSLIAIHINDLKTRESFSLDPHEKIPTNYVFLYRRTKKIIIPSY